VPWRGSVQIDSSRAPHTRHSRRHIACGLTIEAAVVLERALGKHVESAIIAALLAFNAALGYFQESRAQATLNALKSRLALNAVVRRDSAWKSRPARQPTACIPTRGRSGWASSTRDDALDRLYSL
jgi:hypothetical protein